MKKITEFSPEVLNRCICSNTSRDLVFMNKYIDHSNYSLDVRMRLLVKNKIVRFFSSFKVNLEDYLGKRYAYHKKVCQSELIFKDKKIIRCPNCSLTWLHPMPTNAELAQYYGSSFWDNKNAFFQLAAGRTKEKNRAFYQHEYLRPFIDFSAHIKEVLEIGAGSAGISYFINNLYPEISISILEPAESFISDHKNLGICKGTFKDLNEIDKTYDLILSSHSLEHVSNIMDDIGIIAKLLRPNGYFFLEVPNANDIYFNCYVTDIPHTYFYNKQSIQGLAEYFNLKVLDIGTFGPNKKEYLESPVISHEQKNVKNPDGAILRCLLQKQP